jgi:histidyl-tRNA synthetase
MVDLLPQALQRWQAVEAEARAHFQRSGFGEIRTPLMEPTDLFCRGIGEATDVVGKEMYTFNDRGERSCTLRPEGTASVVRSALQHGLLTQGPQNFGMPGRCFAMNGLRLGGNGNFIKSVWSGLGRLTRAPMWR